MESISLDGIESNKDEAPDYRRLSKPTPPDNTLQIDDRIRYFATLKSEAKSRYEEFAKIADDEGLKKVARLFRSIMREEKSHVRGFEHARNTAMNLRTSMAREETKIDTMKSIIRMSDAEKDRDIVLRLEETLIDEENHVKQLEDALLELEEEIEDMRKKEREEKRPKKFSSFGITVSNDIEEDRDDMADDRE